MTLERHISRLLFSHDLVVVPGFGAFVAKSFSAELNGATQMFVPPGRRLSFQPALRNDDGLLLNAVSKAENRHVDVVRLEISDIVSHWHSKLHKGERIRLDNLGLFYIDRQGELQFKPQIDLNYDSDFFGLGVFRASPLVSIPKESRVVPLHERKDRKAFPLWRAVAVAVGVTGLLTIGGIKSEITPDLASFNWFGSDSTDTGVPEESASEVAEETEAVSNREIGKPVPTPEAGTPAIEVNVEPVATSPVERGTYYVIVGSFVEKANADDLYRELRQKGFEPVILPFDGKYSKVAVQSFPSRQAAVEGLRTYKKEVQRGAWIYRK